MATEEERNDKLISAWKKHYQHRIGTLLQRIERAEAERDKARAVAKEQAALFLQADEQLAELRKEKSHVIDERDALKQEMADPTGAEIVVENERLGRALSELQNLVVSTMVTFGIPVDLSMSHEEIMSGLGEVGRRGAKLREIEAKVRKFRELLAAHASTAVYSVPNMVLHLDAALDGTSGEDDEHDDETS